MVVPKLRTVPLGAGTGTYYDLDTGEQLGSVRHLNEGILMVQGLRVTGVRVPGLGIKGTSCPPDSTTSTALVIKPLYFCHGF